MKKFKFGTGIDRCIFHLFAISSFAAEAEDKVIISSIDDLPDITNFKTGVTQIEAQQTGNVFVAFVRHLCVKYFIRFQLHFRRLGGKIQSYIGCGKSSAMLNGKNYKKI
ncbi:MAG: hypothetical protein L6V93_20645 [Clostridiales bacterium]|nr:MAG: hypothetical protein L6V93_20645 [Clostridiales bacterium]